MSNEQVTQTTGVDPATLEVVRNACVAAAEEMNANLIRTSYSPNIKERRDCSCALFDADGRMIAQAENMPVHLGAMPFSVAAALEAYPAEEVSPGDAILVNDPYHGGAHLPDLTLVSPIYYDGKVVAFGANRAHHADVGGSTPGSVAADSTSIYQEGLRIPPIKLYEMGELNAQVMDLITTNVRTPDERCGDLQAQQAANETAKKRVVELIERYEERDPAVLFEEILNYSERRMRGAIRELPDGEYHYEDQLDSDGVSDSPVRIRVTLTVDDATVTVDFEGTDEQVAGPINAVEAVTASASYYCIRCVTDPEIPPNEGCYRPIEVTAPSGTVVNAEPPAPVVGGNLETSQRTVDVVLGALAEASVERVTAAGQGTMNNVTFGGTDPKTGEAYTFYETQAGGFGGRQRKNGMDGVHVHMSNTMNTPAEILERAYPLEVTMYEFREDSGGHGEYRGGLGIRRDIKPINHEASVSILTDRHESRPYGLAGGLAGATGSVELLSESEQVQLDAKTSLTVDEDTILSIRTPGGGGYGLPEERSDDAVARDIADDKISIEAARELYNFENEIQDDTE
jgi:N-methylhydantoinase B